VETGDSADELLRDIDAGKRGERRYMSISFVDLPPSLGAQKPYVQILLLLGSSVGIATGYGLDDQSSLLERAIGFPVIQSVQTACGFHQASKLLGTVASFLGSKEDRS
jgi:hypothetical protein